MKKMLEREKQAEAEAEESKGRAPEGQEKIVQWSTKASAG